MLKQDMRKQKLCLILLSNLLVLTIIGAQNVSLPSCARAEEILPTRPWGCDWGFWNSTTYVGQPVVFSPSISGGVQPYTFEWYTQKYDKQWGTPVEDRVLATTYTSPDSSTMYTFVSNNPGWYEFSVRVTDSHGGECFFNGIGVGIWVHVLETPMAPQPSPPPAPAVVLLSPENTSYTAVYNPYVALSLIFQTNSSLSWVGYSLDGENNITITNGTMIEIPAESKSLTLYANDSAGNWASPQTANYQIAFNLEVARESFSTVPLIIALVIVFVIVTVSLLIHFKKNTQKIEKSTPIENADVSPSPKDFKI